MVAAEDVGICGAEDEVGMTPGPEASSRAQHEIVHGKWLSEQNTESIWGWGSPAGRLRARRRAELVATGAGLRHGVHAIEIGCGTGLFTELFCDSGANIIAVDISEELLAKARARRLPADRVQFVCAQFEETTIPGGYDAVVGSSVLHHLDLARALVAIRRLLRPRGVLSFAEPNLLNPQVFLERHPPFFLRDYYSYTSPDETAFVRWRLRAQLAAAGFDSVTITPFDWLHPSTPPALIPAVRRLGATLERLPIAREFSGSLYIRALKS
jgi:SAM-dependent methyltransferase